MLYIISGIVNIIMHIKRSAQSLVSNTGKHILISKFEILQMRYPLPIIYFSFCRSSSPRL